MKPAIFPYLTEADWQLLRERSRPVHLEKGETALHEGETVRGLFFVESGYLRVEQQHGSIRLAISQVGPGEVFGEMSFLERSAASASVVADVPSEVLTLSEDDTNSLLESVPGLPARLYQSLAVTLSRRLRSASVLTGGVAVLDATAHRSRAPRTGHVTERQLPEALVGAVDSLKQRFHHLEAGLRHRSLPAATARTELFAACDRVGELLATFTENETLVAAGMSDLLAFRDLDSVRAGIGAYIFRETFSTLMTSTTIARCHARPRGIPDDYETMERIHRNEPDGDGRLGPLVDEWFLQRPVAVSRRRSAARAAELLAAVIAGRPAHVTSLASGTCRDTFDLLQRSGSEHVLATCVDLDPESLVAAGEQAQDLGLEGRVTFLLGDVLPLASGERRWSLPPQQGLSALGLLEHLDDESVLSLVNWVHDSLAPEGVAVLTNLASGHRDALFFEHILEARLHLRAAPELTALLRRSRFGEGDVRVDTDGTDLLVRAVRRA